MLKQSKLPLIAAILATAVTTAAGIVGGYQLAGTLPDISQSSSRARENSASTTVNSNGYTSLGVNKIITSSGSSYKSASALSSYMSGNSNSGNQQVSEDQQLGNSESEDARRAAEEERKRLKNEAERQRMEEEAKRMAEEQLRLANERLEAQKEALRQAELTRRKQEEDLRNALQATHQQRVEALVPGAQVHIPLSCLDSNGNLTTDRVACDTTKIDAVSPRATLTPEQEIILEKRAEERFLGTDVVNARRQEILTLIEGTRQRLSGIRDSGLLQGTDVDFLNQSIDWLGGAYGYFTTPERTSDDIAMMRTYLGQIIGYTEQLLQKTRVTAPKIDTLVSKTDVILGTFPDIFWILTREGVPADPQILEEYGAAVGVLNEIKVRCPGEDAQCRRLSEVIGIIESMQGKIQDAIAQSGKTEVNGMIREAIQAKLAPTM